MERKTVQRTLILQTVRSMTNHPSADEIYDKVQLLCPNISRATVYRDLNRLADEGEILRVNVANAADRYDLTNHNHAHCLCVKCGRVFDYKLESFPVLNDDINDGFKATDIYVVVNGICRKCYTADELKTS